MTGYDGNGYDVGDRVELHPASDFWMRGVRYGRVVGTRITKDDRVHVVLDHKPGVWSGRETDFRRID